MTRDRWRLRRLVRPTLVASVALLAVDPAAASAQEPPVPAASAVPTSPAVGGAGAAGLTLAELVRVTLAQNPDILRQARRVDVGQGAILSASAVFDPHITTSLASGRNASPTLDPKAGVTSTLTNSLTYTVGMTSQLPWGMRVTPQVGLKRVDGPQAPGTATNSANVGLTVVVPLLHDWGGTVTSAPRRAAAREYEAARAVLTHTTAASVLNALIAYWSYRAAQQRLEVYQSSEARAQRLVDETRVLVGADERPAGDLKQLLANLAAKRAVRIGAEQSLAEAREQVGLVMGLPPAAIGVLAPAATAFPAPPAGDGDSAAVAAVVEGSLERRADLAAAQRRRDEAALLSDAASNARKPRLDLTVGAGYAGLNLGGGLGQVFSPLYQNVSGLNASVQVSYDLPIKNSGAAGDALQNASLYEQQRIAEEDLARHIRADVGVAVEALRHRRAGLRQATEAVGLYREAVDNEKRKFQLSMSTIFDVILSEDGLTNARLAEIAGREQYAVAIARLRYQTGTLVAAGPGGRMSVDVDRVTREP